MVKSSTGEELRPTLWSSLEGQSPSTGRTCQERQEEDSSGSQSENTEAHPFPPALDTPSLTFRCTAELSEEPDCFLQVVYSAQPSHCLWTFTVRLSGCYTLANRCIFLKYCILK